MKKYSILLFDADGTLFDYAKAEESALFKTLADFRIDTDKNLVQTMYSKINSEFWTDFEKGKISAQKLRTARFEKLFLTLGYQVDCNHFSDCYLNNLSMGSYLIKNAEKLVTHLHGKYKLGLITNGFKEVQRKRFDASAIHSYFETIIISEEVGSRKPEKEIFDAAMKSFPNGDKGTVMIIGDSLSSDILGGNRYGIDTCWFNPEGKENGTDAVPTYEIRELLELNRLLDN